MLPASARMRKSTDFSATMRARKSVGKPTVVVHILRTEEPTRVGFVVSKAVGNAVTRNRVKRKLRHLCLPLVSESPTGINAVVRALPLAASEPGRLAKDLSTAWQKCLLKAQ